MSVFSVDPKADSPVTTEALDEVCKTFGITLKDEEKEHYRKLLAVFDERHGMNETMHDKFKLY